MVINHTFRRHIICDRFSEQFHKIESFRLEFRPTYLRLIVKEIVWFFQGSKKALKWELSIILFFVENQYD